MKCNMEEYKKYIDRIKRCLQSINGNVLNPGIISKLNTCKDKLKDIKAFTKQPSSGRQ